MDFTQGQKRGAVLLKLIASKSKFGLLIGPSGIGKTTMLEAYQNNDQNMTIYKALYSRSLGDMLSDICELWGLPAHGTNGHKTNRLLKAAKGRFLVVDEADQLTRNKDPKHIMRMVETFRYLYDNGAALALVGLPSIYHDIRAAADTYVFSRIRYIRNIEPPDNKFLKAVWTQLSEKATIDDKVIYSAKYHGYFRYLEELADTSKDFGSVEAAIEVMFTKDKQF